MMRKYLPKLMGLAMILYGGFILLEGDIKFGILMPLMGLVIIFFPKWIHFSLGMYFTVLGGWNWIIGYRPWYVALIVMVIGLWIAYRGFHTATNQNLSGGCGILSCGTCNQRQ